MQKTRLYKNIILIIPVLFLFFSAPSALNYVFHFTNEKYDTDTVLQGIEKGNIYRPNRTDITPRFKKLIP